MWVLILLSFELVFVCDAVLVTCKDNSKIGFSYFLILLQTQL